MTKEKFNELIQKLRIGERSALEPIYNEYYSSMKATAFFILRNESDAEDAASEALLKLIIYAERKKTDERIDNPGGFMHVTVKSCAQDMLRKRKKDLSVEDMEICATGDISEQIVDRYDLLKAMDELTDRERELAIRHFLFKEKIKELHKDFDCHYDSVRRKLREIRRKINDKL